MINEEYVNLCEDISKIREKINFVKLKKITITTTTYFRHKMKHFNGEEEGIVTTTTIGGTIFNHISDKKPNDSSDEEDDEELGDLKQIQVSNSLNTEYVVLRVEETQSCRLSIGDDYVEQNVMDCMKKEGVWIDRNAIYSFIKYM